MGILGYIKLGGGLVAAILLGFGIFWLKGRIDRAADADRVETEAAKTVANAKAEVEIANAQIEADRASIAQAEADRAAADRIIHIREDANAALLQMLRARARAVSASAPECNYAPGAHGLLVDAWRGHAPAEGPAVPDAPRQAH